MAGVALCCVPEAVGCLLGCGWAEGSKECAGLNPGSGKKEGSGGGQFLQDGGRVSGAPEELWRQMPGREEPNSYR